MLFLIKWLEKLLIYGHELVRCTKCLLPSTMPFIKFDDQGVCNYVITINSETSQGQEELLKLLEGYGRKEKEDYIVPFWRSCRLMASFGTELGMKPITIHNWYGYRYR